MAHVGDNATVVRSGSDGVQFISVTTEESGNAVRKIARFDVNPSSAHVQKLGPHLNLETQINGKTVTSGPLKNPHSGIDPSTIRSGDYWPWATDGDIMMKVLRDDSTEDLWLSGSRSELLALGRKLGAATEKPF